MNNTFVHTKNQAGTDRYGYSEWLTSPATGRAFRPDDDYGFVSKKEQRGLPALFRDDVLAWGDRQDAARETLAHGRRGWRLVDYHKHRLVLYTFSVKELGGDAWLENPERYFDGALVEGWHRLLDKVFPGVPYKWCLHVGKCGRVGAHAISGAEHAIPHPSNDRRRRKPIGDTRKDYERTFAYLVRRMAPTPEQVTIYHRAVEAVGGERHLVQHSGFRNMKAAKQPKVPVVDVVRDGNFKKVPVGIGFHENTPQVSLSTFEFWLSAEFGDFDKYVLLPSPPKTPPAGIKT